ncbi:hypothetical protein C9374_003333 [Naegleria lovaniensis]|uniref:Phosphatidylethanolamine-binding protein n=1 Tax=Naegleria lovaniensis TaxID=51637 RepID=A0AA88GSM1_NAELO|nr:uncharacterized protein C9374_003333 [Naegleria lovaniensis]KAG2385518.1 hypothetical protein C9374_003333 [Naegleria lovaniensis]
MHKFNTLSLLRNSSSAVVPSNLVALPSSRAYSTYRVKIKRHRAPKGLGAKQHHQKSFLTAENIPESTQHLFEHPDFKRENRYFVSRIDMLSMGKAPTNLPKVTQLSNSEWQQQMKEKTIKAFEQLDLHVDLFPKQVEEPTFRDEISANLTTQLSVTFAKAKEEQTFSNTSLLGNFIESKTTEQLPTVKFEGEKDALYTLVMLTPDYPFRLIPDRGSFIHWMVANIPGSGDVSQGNTICSYIPPLPTECAGTFRYIFLLYKQSEKMDNVEKVKEILLTTEQYKQPQQYEILKQDQDLNRKMKEKMRRHAYEYEYEYIDQMIDKKFKAHSNLVTIDGQNEFDIKGSDYRPVQTPEQTAKTFELNQRRYFDLSKLINESKKPAGMCFFRTEYDFNVTELYQKNQWKEPFYIPPDIIHNEIVKKHKVYQGLSIKKQNYMNTLNWV